MDFVNWSGQATSSIWGSLTPIFEKAEISEENDNAPVGILLVADKDHTLVKFATAGMDQNLFVQQYLVKLPSKEQLEKYIDSELSKLK